MEYRTYKRSGWGMIAKKGNHRITLIEGEIQKEALAQIKNREQKYHTKKCLKLN